MKHCRQRVKNNHPNHGNSKIKHNTTRETYKAGVS